MALARSTRLFGAPGAWRTDHGYCVPGVPGVAFQTKLSTRMVES